MTKHKKTIIIIRSVLAVVLTAIAVCIIIANSQNDKSTPSDELASWQSMIEDETLLKNIATPGAHDAGTKGLPYFAATQNKTIAELLNCGTRYIDLRVAYAKGRLVIYHGPSKGMALSQALDDTRAFLTEHPTETVILDFQHFKEKADEAQQDTVKLAESKLNGMLISNDNANLPDVEFIDGLTLANARGKCLIVWGRETDSILSKNFVFKRNNDDGSRENSVIHSYYTGSLNKKSSKNYVKTALPTYLNKYKQTNSGLFVLQGQLTDGVYVLGPKFREATHTKRMNAYLDGLKNSDDLQYINIVIRDFITPSKNCYTLQLNLSKGVVKQSSVSAYEKMIADNLK